MVSMMDRRSSQHVDGEEVAAAAHACRRRPLSTRPAPNGSAASDLALGLEYQELTFHMLVNIAPKGNLRGFANARCWIRLRGMLKVERHRLPWFQMVGPEPFAFLASNLHAAAFLLDNSRLEQRRADSMSHRTIVTNDDGRQGTRGRVALHLVSLVRNRDFHFHLRVCRAGHGGNGCCDRNTHRSTGH